MKVYSYPFSNAYSPAAPVVTVTVYSPGEPNDQVQLALMLDTGADVTALPLRALKEIDAEYLESVTLLGIAGGRVRVDTYRVVIQLGPHTMGGVRVIGVAASSNAVLGRDVLNQLTMVLDGPANVTEIEG